jgi:cysteine desulfurase
MIYFDYAASNPMDERVRQAVVESLELLGNPSAVHQPGRSVREAVDRSRTAVADLLGVKSGEIVFTSGATEANNLALFGYFGRLRQVYGPDRELRLLVSSVEHSSVRDSLQRLAAEHGVVVDRVPVDAAGVVQSEDVAKMIQPSTVMVCVMWVNNVVGARQPVGQIGAAIQRVRSERAGQDLPIVFMSDAVQALRTEDVAPVTAHIDLLSLSSHKIYGPKGIGALYVRSGLDLAPLMTGGGQEGGLRPGTENVPGIVGLGRAAELLLSERAADRQKIASLSSDFRLFLSARPGLVVVGTPENCAPGIIYTLSQKESGDVLALKLDAAGLAVSSGSACDAGTRKTTSVLQELGLGQKSRRGGVRFSFGRFTTDDELRSAMDIVQRV